MGPALEAQIAEGARSVWLMAPPTTVAGLSAFFPGQKKFMRVAAAGSWLL